MPLSRYVEVFVIPGKWTLQQIKHAVKRKKRVLLPTSLVLTTAHQCAEINS